MSGQGGVHLRGPSESTRLIVHGAHVGFRWSAPRCHRQCVVQWHLIRNNGLSSHILMVRACIQLDVQLYIASENRALVLELAISHVYTYIYIYIPCIRRIPFHVDSERVCTRFHTAIETCARAETQHPRTRASLRASVQMRLNFVDDKSRP